MTYAPTSLTNLQRYWQGQGGVALGIVGNTAHVYGYHCGKDRIFDGAGAGVGWADYSVKTPRDKAGLTNAASAIDLGRLDGSLEKLWTFSAWLASQCMANAADTKDVREIIFWSPSRNRVMGWSDLSPGALIVDYGDATHKTHTHISYYRDSEARPKIPLFKRYLEPPVVPPKPEEDMILTSYLPGYIAAVKPTANIRLTPSLIGAPLRTVATGETWALTGTVKGDLDNGSDQWYVRWNQTRWEYTAKANVPVTPVAPPTPADLAVANAKVTTATAAAAAANASLTTCKAAAAAANASLATTTASLTTSNTNLAACNLKVTKAKAALA
jgi:hypothetical protein